MDSWKEYDKFKTSSELTLAYYNLVAACLDKGIAEVSHGVRCDTALDIACGYGDSTRPLLKIATHIDGVDLSEALIDKAKHDPDLCAVNFYCSDFLTFEPPVKYDLMLATWFHNQLATEAMQVDSRNKIRALASDESQFVFIFPNSHFTDAQTIKFASMAGLTVTVLDVEPKCTRVSYWMEGEPEETLFFWAPDYIKALYDEDFDCRFVDCADLFQNTDLYQVGLLHDLPFSVLVGRKS